MAGYVGGAVAVAVNFIVMLVAGIVFSTIGGVIGAAIFRAPPSSADGIPPALSD